MCVRSSSFVHFFLSGCLSGHLIPERRLNEKLCCKTHHVLVGHARPSCTAEVCIGATELEIKMDTHIKLKDFHNEQVFLRAGVWCVVIFFQQAIFVFVLSIIIFWYLAASRYLVIAPCANRYLFASKPQSPRKVDNLSIVAFISATKIK